MGWTIDTYNYYKVIKIASKQKTEIRSKNWEAVISNTILKYKDPELFGKAIKRLKGSKTT